MQHGEIDRALDIAAKTSIGKQAGEDVTATRLGPQPAEHQVRPDAGAAQLRQLAAIIARQHDRAPGMPRRRGDQPVEETRCLDLVAPAERLDDPLNVAAALARVLHEVEVLVRSNLLDADEHGAAPCSRKSTTIRHGPSSKIATLSRGPSRHLAPQFNHRHSDPCVSAASSHRITRNCGSWV